MVIGIFIYEHPKEKIYLVCIANLETLISLVS